MKREDFMFTIGYQGDTALVDGKAKKEYGKLDLDGLLEKGLYRAAFCAAVYEENEEQMNRVVEEYNRASGASLASPQDMKRMLGVFQIPQNISKVKVL
jgi:hypothetical protein